MDLSEALKHNDVREIEAQIAPIASSLGKLAGMKALNTEMTLNQDGTSLTIKIVDADPLEDEITDIIFKMIDDLTTELTTKKAGLETDLQNKINELTAPV